VKPERTKLGNTGLLAAYLVVFALTAALAWGAHYKVYFAEDLDMALALHGLRTPLMDEVMGLVSASGSRLISVAVVLGIGLFVALRRYAVETLFVLVSLAGDGLNFILKDIVARPRPVETGLVSVLRTEDSASFPSGHAMHAVILYGFLFYLASVHIRNASARLGFQAFLVALVVLTGLSRVYLGAHWPSDVVGGYLLGGLVLVPLIVLYKRALSAIDRWPMWLRQLSSRSRASEE